MKPVDLKKLKKIRSESLKIMLGLYKKANAGHIASSLSCLDILLYLYFYRMKNNDAFILSKGHAALSLYTTLYKFGLVSKSELDSFYRDGTYFAAHTPCTKMIKGIKFGTGSLGHGTPLAAGLAFSTRFTKKKFNVYCLLSDGDLNEGSTWEAVLFAAHHKLVNLYLIIDNNGLQAFGRTKDVLNMEPIEKKMRAFNFNAVTAADGNDFISLNKAFAVLDKVKNKPNCVIAKTTKGSAVSFMEDKLEWHYLPMDDKAFRRAMEEIKE